MSALTDERLAEIEARAQAATPGPLTVKRLCEWTSDVLGPDTPDMPAGYDPTNYVAEECLHTDAELFAHARADVLALGAEVRRLRRVVEAYGWAEMPREEDDDGR